MIEFRPYTFRIGADEYRVDERGAIHQEGAFKSQHYSPEYVVKRYDAIPETVRQMSFLRAGYIIGNLGFPKSLLDVGYGNGDFLAVWRLWRPQAVDLWGMDVSGYPLPEGCRKINMGELRPDRSWDVVTFFDSLEHIPGLDFLGRLNARHIVVTVPWCHGELGLEWFQGWKHRRPGEHLHHFSPLTLMRTMQAYGFGSMVYSSIEDAIRVPVDDRPNTFTAIFKKAGVA